MIVSFYLLFSTNIHKHFDSMYNNICRKSCIVFIVQIFKIFFLQSCFHVSIQYHWLRNIYKLVSYKNWFWPYSLFVEFYVECYKLGLQYSPPTQRLSLYVFIPKAYRRLQPLWRIIYIVIRKAHGSSILYQRLIGHFQFILYLWMKITHYLQR